MSLRPAHIHTLGGSLLSAGTLGGAGGAGVSGEDGSLNKHLKTRV